MKKLALITAAVVIFTLTWGMSWRFFLRSQHVLGLTNDVTPSQIISLTNLVRTQNNVSTLTPNPLLEQAALAKAQDMIDRGYFSHQDPDGLEAWKHIDATGYSYYTAGENLARNFSSSQKLIDAWMKSPGHRSNLLSSEYTEIGLAVVEANNQTYIVQLMAAPIDPVLLAQNGTQKSFQPTRALSGFNLLHISRYRPAIAGLLLSLVLMATVVVATTRLTRRSARLKPLKS